MHDQRSHVDALAHVIRVLISRQHAHAAHFDAYLVRGIDGKHNRLQHQRTVHGRVIVFICARPVAPVVPVPVHPAKAGENNDLILVFLQGSKIRGVIDMKDHGVAIEIEARHLALLDQIRDRHAVNGDKVA